VDIQQFISSGVIEAYVLGIASEDEVRELKSLAAKHPEVAAAIQEIQQTMDDYSSKYAIEPPPELKNQVLSAIEDSGSTVSDNKEAAVESPRTLEFQQGAPIAHRSFGFTAAAAVALLMASVVFNFIFWNKSEKAAVELAQVKTEQEKMIAANNSYKLQLQQKTRTIEMAMDPAMKPVMLAGVGAHTENKAMIFWDTRSKEVYLALKNMPPPPAGKQYQLWAIVDGKPVDAGMYTLHEMDGMQKMKVIPQAEMFAITLEKVGGSPVPTMEEMYVAGKV
jgi:anti-sigma-K factor RskA